MSFRCYENQISSKKENHDINQDDDDDSSKKNKNRRNVIVLESQSCELSKINLPDGLQCDECSQSTELIERLQSLEKNELNRNNQSNEQVKSEMERKLPVMECGDKQISNNNNSNNNKGKKNMTNPHKIISKKLKHRNEGIKPKKGNQLKKKSHEKFDKCQQPIMKVSYGRRSSSSKSFSSNKSLNAYKLNFFQNSVNNRSEKNNATVNLFTICHWEFQRKKAFHSTCTEQLANRLAQINNEFGKYNKK